ncbi:MAG: MATE family efflux transporter [Planctomycetota bacterium]
MSDARGSQASILISNVQINYARMLLTVFLGILTTRMVYRELGEKGFGLFAAVGASVFLVTTLESTLLSSVQRYLAYAVGKDDDRELRETFSTSLFLTVLLGGLTFAVVYPLAPFLISLLRVPPDRIEAAILVLRCTLVSACVMIAAAPFNAMLTANQNFLVPAIVATGVSVLTFLGAYSLRYLPGDSLEHYAMIRLGVVALAAFFNSIFCLKSYQQSRFSGSSVVPSIMPPLLSYGGWAGLGAMGWHLRLQGTQLIGNLFFGPSFNASLGIAQQISGYAGTLPATLLRVANPAMTQMVGRNESAKIIPLRDSTSRFCVLLTFIFCGPLFIELDFLLGVWLESPPRLAALFATIMLCNLLVDHAASGYGLVFLATGRIRGYAIFTFVIVLLQVAATYAFVALTGSPASSILIIFVMATLANLFYRVWYSDGQSIEVATRHWLTRVFLRVVVACVLAVLAASPVAWAFPPSWFRLFSVTLVHTVALVAVAWFWTLTAQEREQAGTYVARIRDLARKNLRSLGG